MTEHDRIRRDRAEACDESDIESVLDAIGGLQSTDDPALVPLHDRLMARYFELKKAQSSEPSPP